METKGNEDRKEFSITYYQTTVKANILFGNVPCFPYHLVYEWEDAEERNRLDESSVAKQENLSLWQGLIIFVLCYCSMTQWQFICLRRRAGIGHS